MDKTNEIDEATRQKTAKEIDWAQKNDPARMARYLAKIKAKLDPAHPELTVKEQLSEADLLDCWKRSAAGH